MLELLILAFMSPEAQEFFGQLPSGSRAGIEVLEPAELPQKKENKLAPELLNDPYLAIFAKDINSGKTLFAHNVDKAQPIASLTKIMTYLVIRENFDLDEVVSIPLEATRIEGAKAGLYAYEKMTIRTLLEAILIPSGNDAAVALAIADSGTEEVFAQKMNQKARDLGLDSAQFYNATGLDILEAPRECVISENIEDCDASEVEVYGNKMSVREALMMAQIALQDDFFRETVQKDTFYGESADQKFVHEKKSTNQLLGAFINSKGVKTGYTNLAGQCFINLSVDEEGREILTAVLGSSDRFGETKKLMHWIWESFTWR